MHHKSFDRTDPQQLAQHTAVLLQQQPPATPGRARKQRVIPQRPRETIWTGDIEWIEKEKHDQPNVIRQIPCNIASNLENSEPEMYVFFFRTRHMQEHVCNTFTLTSNRRANNWPTRLSLQLLPKPVAQNIHSHYFKDSKSVYVNFSPCEALDNLAEVIASAYVSVSQLSRPASCIFAQSNRGDAFVPPNSLAACTSTPRRHRQTRRRAPSKRCC